MRRSDLVGKAALLIPVAILVLLLIFYPPWAAGAAAIYTPLCFLLTALLLAPGQAGLLSGLDYLGLAPERDKLPSLLVWSAVALACCCALTLYLSGVLYALGLLDTEPVQAKILSLPLPALIASFTLAPLGEEALFRGFIFRKLAGPHYRSKEGGSWFSRHFPIPGMPWLFGALVSSLIFALLHFAYGSIAEVIVAFSIGMLFCFFTYRTRSLIPAVIAHAGYNFLSIGLGVICARFACPF